MPASSRPSPSRPLDLGISAFQVRTGRSGSHEPYVRGLLQGLGELRPDASITLYLQDPDFDVPESFRALPGATVEVWSPRDPQRAARLLNEARLGLTRRHDALFFSGSSVAPLSRSPQVVMVHADSRLQPGSYGHGQGVVAGSMLELMRFAVPRRVLGPTEVYAAHLHRAWGIGRRRLQGVWHGVGDMEALADPLDLGAGQHIVAVTNAKAHKNLPTLLRAWRDVNAEDPRVQLWLVGVIPPEVVVGALGEVPAGLHLVGWKHHPDVMHYIGAGDILVFPSEQETFGMPLAEAMAAGTPIVAADTDVAREVCAEAALLVPPRDASALVAAFRRVLFDAAFASVLRERGLQRAESFTWRRSAEATIEAVCEAIGRPVSAST